MIISMTATIGSDTIQRSARAGTMVTGLFITLANWNTGRRWSAMYNTVFYSRIMPYFIPGLCQLRERAYYARNYAGIIAASLVTIQCGRPRELASEVTYS